jgi:hypothetical protein
MRVALFLGAAALLAIGTTASAQQPAAATGAAQNPVARLVSAVRERLSGRAEAAPRVKQATSHSRRVKRRTKQSRRTRSQRVHQSSPAPWPRPVAKRQHPASSPRITVLRTRTVRRPSVEVVIIAGELLSLPAVEITGMPVHLDVPTIGPVDIPEERYREIFDLLVSGDAQRQHRALGTLRELRDATEALRQWARRRSSSP